MKDIYSKLKSQAAYLEDDGLRYSFYFSLCRSVLQLSATTALELCWKFGGEEIRPIVCEKAKKLLHPSDGDFFDVLDTSIINIRLLGWKNCVPTWFDIPSSYRSELVLLPLRETISKLNQERNNRPGHGVVSSDVISETLQWLPTVTEELIEGLSDLIPSCKGDNLVLTGGLFASEIESIRSVNCQPIVVRRYKRKGSTWRCNYQVVDPHKSGEGYFEVSESCPLISAASESSSHLKSTILYVDKKVWRPSFVLPYRQTEAFEGREDELKELYEWWNDPDSRACLIYGEGGIGKTTLALQFLNEITEAPTTPLNWFPDLIFYYSAKQTRWGVSGLEYLSGVIPSVAESVRSMVSTLEPSLGTGWIEEDPRKLIDKASNFLSQVGLERDNVLIVLDNTETLARTSQQAAELTRVLRQVSTKIGRLLMTSRRREKVEAMPIQILPMDEDTGATLLKRLGETYEAKPLISAGESTLKRVSRQLSGKPLLLDVLARHISISASGIDQSLRAVLQQSRGDLGEFLFEDAWNRMTEDHQQVFLVIGQLGGAVAEQMVAWTCAEIGINVSDWLETFNETRFGTVSDYGTYFDLSIEPGAREFLTKKHLETKSATCQDIDRTATRVRKKYEDLLRAQSSKVTDRVVTAFRTSAAKAAKIAAQMDNKDEAIMWYEEAITNDPGNAALLDRFAWYLMVNKDFSRAWRVAQNACQVDTNDADAHFTAGMIAGRMGNIAESDRLLDKAQTLGKKGHLCTLQKARSRIEKAKDESHTNTKKELLDKAHELIEKSDINKAISLDDSKHQKERRRLQKLIASLSPATELRKEPQIILKK